MRSAACALLIAAGAAGTLLVAAVFAPLAQAQTCNGQLTWNGIAPNCLAVGDSYRILFVTRATRDATSTDIATYNDFVQTQADGATGSPFTGITFNALASTAEVHAFNNTATTPNATVPIFYYRGRRAADDYNDLYDGNWDTFEPRDENGNTFAGEVIAWAGIVFSISSDRQLGTAMPITGNPTRNFTQAQLLFGLNEPNTENHPLYALSEVLTLPGRITVDTPANGTAFEPGDTTTFVTTFSTAADFQFDLTEFTAEIVEPASGVTLAIHPDAIAPASLTVGGQQIQLGINGFSVSIGGSTINQNTNFNPSPQRIFLTFVGGQARQATATEDLRALMGAIQMTVTNQYTGPVRLRLTVEENSSGGLNGGTQERFSTEVSYTVAETVVPEPEPEPEPVTPPTDPGPDPVTPTLDPVDVPAVFNFTDGNDDNDPPLSLFFDPSSNPTFKVTSTPEAERYKWSARRLARPNEDEIMPLPQSPTPFVVANADETVTLSDLMPNDLMPGDLMPGDLVELMVTTTVATQTRRERYTGRFLLSAFDNSSDAINTNTQTLDEVTVVTPHTVLPGVYAIAAEQTASARITTPQDVIPGTATPPGYMAETGMFSFTVNEIGDASSVNVVIELASTLSTQTATATPYKYDIEAQSWDEFNNDGPDTWAGATMTNGACPAADDAAWTSSLLVTGDQCLRVTLTDGDANDADRTKNGVIHDPIALGAASTKGGGGAIHGFWLLALLLPLIGLACARRRRF